MKFTFSFRALCVGALIFGSAIIILLVGAINHRAQAQTTAASSSDCPYWIDEKTGEHAATGPWGWHPSMGHDDVTSPNGRVFVFGPSDGSWIDEKTGEHAATGPWGWHPSMGHDDVTSPNGRVFVFVPCPPTTTESSTGNPSPAPLPPVGPPVGGNDTPPNGDRPVGGGMYEKAGTGTTPNGDRPVGGGMYEKAGTGTTPTTRRDELLEDAKTQSSTGPSTSSATSREAIRQELLNDVKKETVSASISPKSNSSSIETGKPELQQNIKSEPTLGHTKSSSGPTKLKTPSGNSKALNGPVGEIPQELEAAASSFPI